MTKRATITTQARPAPPPTLDELREHLARAGVTAPLYTMPEPSGYMMCLGEVLVDGEVVYAHLDLEGDAFSSQPHTKGKRRNTKSQRAERRRKRKRR